MPARFLVLKKILEKTNIKRTETMAIGDSEVDLGIIKYAGIGVAMSNAPDYIKDEADYVTKSNDEDGVAEAIEKFALD